MTGNKTQIFEIVHDGTVQATAFTLTSTAYSVRLFTGTTASAGKGSSSFWTGLRIQSGADQNVYEPPVRPAVPVPEEQKVDEEAFRGPGYIAYKKITTHDGYKEITFAKELPAGTYTLLVNVSSTETHESRPSRIRTTASAYNDSFGLIYFPGFRLYASNLAIFYQQFIDKQLFNVQIFRVLTSFLHRELIKFFIRLRTQGMYCRALAGI